MCMCHLCFTVLLTGLIIGRDAILIAFGFYIRYQSLDPPVRKSYFSSCHYFSTYSPGTLLGLTLSLCFPYYYLYFWNSLSKKCDGSNKRK